MQNSTAKSPYPVFDGHNDTLLRLEIEAIKGRERSFFDRSRIGHLDMVRAREAGFAGGLFAMFVPSDPEQDFSRPFNPKDPANFAPVEQPLALSFTNRLLERAERIVDESEGSVVVCRSPEEISAAIDADRLAVSLHIEGAEAIDTEFYALEDYYKRGLRSLGLVWSRENAFGYGVPMELPASPDIGPGLSGAGRDLVRACNQLGVLVDVSHLNEKGFWDVARITDRPIVASHSNAHSISPSRRNLTDKQLDAIKESGGLVGLNFHVPFLRPDGAFTRDTPLSLIADHAAYLVDRVGEDCVALGSDFDGCTPPKDLGDVTGLSRLMEALHDRGFNETVLEKIAFRNWIAALEKSAR
ncbi:dipeptidase [Roseibium aggregatum]|uniref:Dipeptidase n=1 Tax=Roseibium aggregatum TaxID=187304 RepID=A0A939EBL1_9HYPH|nr:membrane dipeptidase [Roseibium aggregatum]MBN9669559.1 dipeptidase [Roseibium aggregatum]